MKNLISQEGIGPKELCKRIGKYKGGIDEEMAELYKKISKDIGSKGKRTEDDALVDKILLNFSEIVCMELHQNSQADGPISFVMDYLVKNKIPASYTEKFIFGFKEIIVPYLQKEFSERYYAYFTAQKLVDEALRKIWMKSMDRYYHFTIGAIEESAKRYRALFESSRDAIMTLEPPSWKFTSGNAATVSMFRAKDEKTFTSLGPWEVSPKYQPDGQLSALKAKKMIMKAMKEGSNFFEWTHKKLGGEDFPAIVLLTRVELDGKKLLQATVRDITNEKKAEEKLRQSERKYRVIIENATDWIFLLDTKQRFISLNNATANFLHKSASELIGKSILGIFPKESATRFAKNNKEVVETGKGKFIEEKMVGGGREFYINTSLNPVKDSKGKVIAVMGIVRDNTEKKRAEENLKESEETFRSIFENAGDGILVADTEKRRFLMANRKICRMLGYGRKELLKLDVSKIHPKKDLPHVVRAFKMQAQKKMNVARGLPVLRKDGTVFYADISSGPFVLKGKRYMMGFFRPVGGT
jgi:PAS domain S-box-containing protein